MSDAFVKVVVPHEGLKHASTTTTPCCYCRNEVPKGPHTSKSVMWLLKAQRMSLLHRPCLLPSRVKFPRGLYPVLKHIFHCLADYATEVVAVEIMKDIEKKVEVEEPRGADK
jgi:hypothetical protein